MTDKPLGLNIAAAMWIMVLPCTRGGMSPAAKVVLLALWKYTKWDLHESQKARPSRETLAADTGLSASVVRDALAKLAELGWITRVGSGWRLAWAEPTVQADSDSTAQTAATVQAVDGSSDEPGGSSDSTDGLSDEPDGSSRRPSERSPSISPSLERGEARTIPIPTATLSSEAIARDRELAPVIAAQHEAKRAAPPASPIDSLPPGIWQVVVNHNATFQEAQNPGRFWVPALGTVVAEFRLTPDELRALLDRWESQRLELGTAGYNAAVRAGTFPPVASLWFSRGQRYATSRKWVEDNVEAVQLPAGAVAAPRPIKVDNSTAAALPGNTAEWEANRDQKQAEHESRQARGEPEPEVATKPISWGWQAEQR